MFKVSKVVATSLGMLMAAACGSHIADLGPCQQTPPNPACDDACDPTPGAPATCPDGFHCSAEGACSASCTVGSDECGAGFHCTTDGLCDDDANPGQPDAMPPDCPSVTFTPTPTIPSVELLLDASGSMIQNGFAPFDTRWDALKSALINPTDGVIPALQGSVYFGATTYREHDPVCPQLQVVPRVLDNLAEITTLLEATPGNDGGTPTGPAIDAAVAGFSSAPAPVGSPPIIVLATDGEPFLCPDNIRDGKPAAIAAAAAAHAAGIDVFVLAVATGGGVNDHLQQVANAGVGAPDGTNAPFFIASSPQDLRDAFNTIIRGVVSCSLTLDGVIDPALASDGHVRLNGRELTFGTEWDAPDGTTVRLIGAACAELQESVTPMVEAEFPCGTVIG